MNKIEQLEAKIKQISFRIHKLFISDGFYATKSKRFNYLQKQRCELQRELNNILGF